MGGKIIRPQTLNHFGAEFSYSNADVPFYASLYLYAAYAVSLFWSVFGPAARYNFGNPEYVYAALMKP